MNWKNEAEEQLKLYEQRKKALAGMMSELALGPEPGMDGLVRFRELKERRDRTAVWVGLVEEALDGMEPEDRLVLDGFYIHPIRRCADWLCGELNCEQATVYRRRERALQRFTVALYG